MEEAEALCDRLGIFVNGELQCIGNAKEVIISCLLMFIFAENYCLDPVRLGKLWVTDVSLDFRVCSLLLDMAVCMCLQ